MARAPPPDAVEEFNIQTHQNDAGATFAAGANINVVTKTGTNDLHGSLYEFHRNEKMSANNFMDNFFGREKVPFKQNQFGYTLGGPVYIPGVVNGRESNTYFFSYYEGFTLRRDATTRTTVPDNALRNGDFSQLLGPKIGVDELGRDVFEGQIYDIETTRPCSACASGFIRDPFPGNVIPSNRIRSTATAYYDFIYPQANREGIPNLVLAQPRKFDGYQFGIRLDHSFSPNRRVYGRFNNYRNQDDTPGALPEIPTQRINNGINTMAHWTEVVSPTFLFDVQLGYNRTGVPFRNKPQGDEFRAAAGPEFVFEAPGGWIPSRMNLIGSQFTGAAWSQFELANPDDSYQLSTDFKKSLTKHDLSFGYKILHWRHRTRPQGSKQLWFTDSATDQPGFVGSGESLASFMLGLPNTSINALFPYIKNYGWIHVFYLQDRWRVTPKLTVNLGLQYLYSTPPREQDDRFSMADFALATTQPDATDWSFAYVWAAPNPITGEPPNARYPSILAPDRNNFAPRLGIAYAVTDKTVIRTGIGVFYDFNQNLVQNTQARKGTTRWPFGERYTLTGHNTAMPSDINFDNPFPDPFAGPALDVDGGDLFPRDPYAINWNFGIQQQLPAQMVLTTEYVGSIARKMPLNFFINLADVGPGPIAPRRQLRTLGAQRFQDDNGSSNYNALQLKLERRYSAGLTFRSSYTWSKALDYGTDANGISNGTRDFSIEYGPTTFDLTHNYTLSYVYEFPFGRGKAIGSSWSGVVDAILGGWQSSGIINLRSGLRFSTITGADSANVGNPLARIRLRPNQVSDPFGGNVKTREAWFNPDAFELPAFGTLGNHTKHALKGPAFQTVDFAMLKYFRFTETAGLQFRAEFFNLFNHANLGNPVNNIRSGAFGQILSANPARDIQFALKLYW